MSAPRQRSRAAAVATGAAAIGAAAEDAGKVRLSVFFPRPGGRYILWAIFFAISPAICLAGPTFYRDVLPVLQEHCQGCHRPGEIGPMPLTSYAEVRPWAKAILNAVLARKMPPWFADPRYGKFSNDPTLTPTEVDTVAAWVRSGAPAGRIGDAPPARVWPRGWAIGTPDAVFQMPRAIRVPAKGELEYQYMIVPTGFRQDRWVRKVEIRPGDRRVVHHAVVYIREPGSNWLKNEPVGAVFTVPAQSPGAVTHNDILFTYTPGNAQDGWPDGMAKLIPAGSDLVFQMHYTPTGQADAFDRSRIGMIFTAQTPAERVLTLQLNGFHLFIPPGDPDYRAAVSGTLPNPARLLSLYPHMHLRGKWFEYAIGGPENRRTLLKVHGYNFYWQLTYRLAEPLLLNAGTKLECVAAFDNSANNPRNPDPGAMVYYGERSSDEMLIGFFDVAVPAGIDKSRFFERHGQAPAMR